MDDEGPENDDAATFDRLRRRVLWSMPTGLYVIGSRAGEPPEAVERNLMTANLVVQVAVDPKLVAVAIDRHAVTCRLVARGGRFSVGILARQDRTLVRRFIKPVPPADIVTDGHRVVSMVGEPVFEPPGGAPIPTRSVAWLDCRVRQQLDLGSHHLFVGEVVAAGGPDGPVPDVLRMEDTKMNYGG